MAVISGQLTLQVGQYAYAVIKGIFDADTRLLLYSTYIQIDGSGDVDLSYERVITDQNLSCSWDTAWNTFQSEQVIVSEGIESLPSNFFSRNYQGILDYELAKRGTKNAAGRYISRYIDADGDDETPDVPGIVAPYQNACATIVLPSTLKKIGSNCFRVYDYYVPGFNSEKTAYVFGGEYTNTYIDPLLYEEGSPHRTIIPPAFYPLRFSSIRSHFDWASNTSIVPENDPDDTMPAVTAWCAIMNETTYAGVNKGAIKYPVDVYYIVSGLSKTFVIRNEYNAATCAYWRHLDSRVSVFFKNLADEKIDDTQSIFYLVGGDNLQTIRFSGGCNVEELGYGCFADCKILRDIDFQGACPTTDGACFANCFELQHINFGNDPGYIMHESDFANCFSLVDFNDGNVVAGIAGSKPLAPVKDVFKNCVNISKITFPDYFVPDSSDDDYDWYNYSQFKIESDAPTNIGMDETFNTIQEKKINGEKVTAFDYFSHYHNYKYPLIIDGNSSYPCCRKWLELDRRDVKYVINNMEYVGRLCIILGHDNRDIIYNCYPLPREDEKSGFIPLIIHKNRVWWIKLTDVSSVTIVLENNNSGLNDIIDDESGNEEISEESDDTTIKKDPLMWDEVETFKNRLGTFDRKKLEEEKDMPDNLGIHWFEQLPHYLGYNPVGP